MLSEQVLLCETGEITVSWSQPGPRLYNPTPNSNPLTPRYILCKMGRIQPLVRIKGIMGNPWHAQAQTAVKVTLNYTVA